MNDLDPTQIERLKEIGAHLRQHRDSLSISLEEVAQQTFIPVHILQALEAGESDRLPEPVYIQGFIRRYGDVLKLDGTILANSFPASISLVTSDTSNSEEPEALSSVLPVQYYDSSNEEEPKTLSSKLPVKSGRSSSKKSKGSSNNIPLYLTYILLVVAASSTLFYVLKKPQSPSPDIQVTESPSPEAQVTESPSPETQVTESPSPETQVTESPSPEAQVTESPSPEAQVTESPSPKSQETVTTSSETNESIEVTVNLNDESWVRVIVDGKTEFEGLLTKEDKQTWTANEELTIRAGNAGAVVVSLNQKEPKPLGEVGAVEEVTFTKN